jgi:hypothetical protein
MKFFLEKFWWFEKSLYLCTRFQKNPASEGSDKFTWTLPSAADFRLGTSQMGAEKEFFDRFT